MTNTQMLQAIFDKITSVESTMRTGFQELNHRIDNLTKRVDTIGLQLARLEDDTPNMEEFENLEKRVDKIEKKVMN